MSSFDSIYNYFIHFNVDEDNKKLINKSFPSEIPDGYLNKIFDYGLSCCSADFISGSVFLIIFTDHTGLHEYVYVLTSGQREYQIITTYYPYHEAFYQLLTSLYHYSKNVNVSSNVLTIFNKLKKIPNFKIFSSLRITLPGIDNCIRLIIPSNNETYFYRFLLTYIESLDTSSIIDIHTSLLLERNVLFVSSSRSKLTGSILAAHSLLYPMTWVHCLYPILPAFALEVLESPVPFVAGIHSCLLEKAKRFLSSGTRLVHLDEGRVYLIQTPRSSYKTSLKKSKSEDSIAFDSRKKSRSSNFDSRYNEPENTLNGEIPDAVVSFFLHGLKPIDKLRLKVHKNSQLIENKENISRPLGDLRESSYQFTDTFFDFNVNILGFYSECQEKSKFGDFLEPNIKKMVAIQGCRSVSKFLSNVYDSQMCRVFFDERIQNPSRKKDKFDEVSDIMNRTILKKFSKPVSEMRPEELAVFNYGESNWRLAKNSNISATIAYHLFTYRSASSRLIDKLKKRSRTQAKADVKQKPSTVSCLPTSFNSNRDNVKTWGSYSDKKSKSTLVSNVSGDEHRKAIAKRLINSPSVETLTNPTSYEELIKLRTPEKRPNQQLRAVKVTSVNSFSLKKPSLSKFSLTRPSSSLEFNRRSSFMNSDLSLVSQSSVENSPINFPRHENGHKKGFNNEKRGAKSPNSTEPIRKARQIPPRPPPPKIYERPTTNVNNVMKFNGFRKHSLEERAQRAVNENSFRITLPNYFQANRSSENLFRQQSLKYTSPYTRPNLLTPVDEFKVGKLTLDKSSDQSVSLSSSNLSLYDSQTPSRDLSLRLSTRNLKFSTSTTPKQTHYSCNTETVASPSNFNPDHFSNMNL